MNLKILNKDDAFVSIVSEDKTWQFEIRFDGCLHMYDYFNGSTYETEPYNSDNVAYMHICSIDNLISMLREIKDIAKQHFGDDWKS